MSKYKSSFIFLIVITALVFIVFQFGWSQYKEPVIEGMIIQTNTNKLEEVASLWLKQYINDYQTLFTPYSVKIKRYRQDSIEILDREKGYVQVNYSYIPSSYNNQNKGSLIEDDWYRDQVVIRLEKRDDHYEITENMRPVNYQIMTDENIYTDGYKEPEQIMMDKENTYLIQNEILYVTYNHGESFKKVPIDYKMVTYLPSNGTSPTSLQEGSYLVDEMYSGFLYIENQQLKLIYSFDQGETWTNTTITNNEHQYLEERYLSKTEDIYYVICSFDKTMSAISHQLYTSKDSVQFTSVPLNEPETHALSYVTFLEDDLGYFAYTRNEDIQNQGLYLTQDGGNTFEAIEYEKQMVDINGYRYSPYIQVDQIYKEEDKIYMIVGQGAYGDFGYDSAQYISEDGIHFTYVGKIDTRIPIAG